MSGATRLQFEGEKLFELTPGRSGWGYNVARPQTRLIKGARVKRIKATSVIAGLVLAAIQLPVAWAQEAGFEGEVNAVAAAHRPDFERISSLAMSGEVEAANEQLVGLTQKDNKLTEDGEICFEYAAVQLLSGNRDEYKRTCEHMLKRCGKPAMRPFLVARGYTLAPCAIVDLTRAAQLSSNELHQADSEHWSLTVQGSLAYRSGRFIDAIPLFERSIAADDKPGAAVLNWLWLAMAHEKLGHADEARRWLKKATSWLDQLGDEIPPNSDTFSFHLHNWLEAQVLSREAAEVISR